MNTVLNSKWSFLVLLILVIGSGCNKDDDMDDGPSTDELAAAFQSTVSETNFLEVAFLNTSANATSYSWDFGDGETSTEESPTHVYPAAGTYPVVLTAFNAAGESKERTSSVTLIDPNVQSTILAGNGSKTWYLQREGVALGIGPGINNNEWWSFGGVTPLGDRPCILDDSWTFNADGTVDFVSNGTIFIDSEGNGGWLGPNSAEGCFDDTDPNNMTSINGDDLSSFATGGDYTYDYDQAAGTLTVDGEGFFIGLANKRAGDDNFIPATTITYDVFNISEGTIADTLQVALSADGSQAWNFYLVSYKDPSDLPDIPGASAPTAGFTYSKNGFTFTFTNSSSSATDYAWDFGDGGTSTEANPTHTYASEGDYTVTLTASNSVGSDMATEVVTISSVVFSPAVLSSATGKTWRLDGAGSYIVGSGPGMGDYWPGLDEAGAMERACQMDDEFIFTDGGTMEYATLGQVWAEDYMGGAFACTNEGDLVSPYDVFASGTHSFSATDTQITVTGNGAFLGFNKPFNGGELDGSIAPATEITYEVLDYTVSGNTETLTITINYGMANDHWTMRLVSTN